MQLEDGPRQGRVGPVTSTYQSRLFGSLFQWLDVNRRLTVLDIGTALPETVNFFSQYICRLHFIDLYTSLQPAFPAEQTTAMPRVTATAQASDSGSVRYDS